jgi:hypothetical protein
MNFIGGAGRSSQLIAYFIKLKFCRFKNAEGGLRKSSLINLPTCIAIANYTILSQ